jgi:hypothetical protein
MAEFNDLTINGLSPYRFIMAPTANIRQKNSTLEKCDDLFINIPPKI